MSKKNVLVTGAAGFWGQRVAEKLSATGAYNVMAIDAKAPKTPLKDVDFIQADIRNVLITELLKAEEIDTVVHLAFRESTRHSESNFDFNVMGTMKFFGMCATAGVRKIVYRSSATVYGALPVNSMFLDEKTPLKGSRRYGSTRHWVEVEAFINGFIRQHPETSMTILRFVSIVGPQADTPMTRFLTNMRAPLLWGFNPMMQVIHEDDVVGALVHAVDEEKPGVFNIGAEGVLPLKRIARLAGKVPLTVLHPVLYTSLSVSGARYAPIEPDYIRYPWVVDLTRMRDDFEFTPHYTADEALREFGSKKRLSQFVPDFVGKEAEDLLRDVIERRRRAREQESA